jgi:hypothetical protein
MMHPPTCVRTLCPEVLCDAQKSAVNLECTPIVGPANHGLASEARSTASPLDAWRWAILPRAEVFALVRCSHAHFFFFEAARKGGTLEVKNLAEEGGKLFRPKVGRTCAVD